MMPEEDKHPATTPEPARVLVLDDDEACQRLLTAFLTKFGHSVAMAEDGREGLQLLLRRDFDVVVVDLRMRKMEGFAFIQEARKIWPWLSFIITSGHIDEESKQRAQELHVHHTLRKPLDLDHLGAAVAEESGRTRDRLKEITENTPDADARQRQLGMLRQLGQTVMASESIVEALRRLSAGLTDLLPSAVIGALAVEDGECILFLAVQEPVNQASLSEIKEEMLKRYALLGGRVLSEDNVSVRTEGDVGDNGTAAPALSTFSVPIIAEGEIHGLLTLASADKDAYASSDISFLYHIAHQFSSFLVAMSRMRRLAAVDELTGLHNRRHLEQTLAQAWRETGDSTTALAVAILDIDHFKRFNDTYGHLVGDQILREMAAIIRNVSRASDITSRYGGDELVVTMQRVQLPDATACAKRLLQSIRDHVFCESSYRLRITVSIGLAISNSPAKPADANALIADADKAMYEAKQRGRDRVCVWPCEEIPDEEEQPAELPVSLVAHSAGEGEKRRGRIMVVDDDGAVSAVLKLILEKQGHELTMASTVKEAEATLRKRSGSFDLVITDLVLPDGSGLDLLKMLQSGDESIMRIVITGHASLDNAVESIEYGAFSFIEKPISADHLRASVDRALAYRQLLLENMRYRNHLEEMVREKSAELGEALDRVERSYEFTLEALAAMLDAREQTAGQHSVRVRDLALVLGREMNLSDEELDVVARGALLHDIGKISVPDAVLLKPSALSDQERLTMNSHPEVGFRIIESSPVLTKAAEIVLSHHESFDGSGYPSGLSGDAISFGARIFAVIDAYDAMRSHRVYRQSVSEDEAVAEIKKHSGTQFDPSVVDAFMRCREEIEKVGNWPPPESGKAAAT